MTPEEAIKTIRVAMAEVEWEYPMDYQVAFETAIVALEKQMPKKPKQHTMRVPKCFNEPDFVYYTCPCCNAVAYAIHCDKCGQAIDWSEEE